MQVFGAGLWLLSVFKKGIIPAVEIQEHFMKRLYRSRTDRSFLGVCGGLGEYFDVDPVIFRILFVVLFLFGGCGLLLYLIMALCMPLKPKSP